MRNQGRNDNYDNEAYWDGIDRRNDNMENDRRHTRYSEDIPPGYWQYPHQIQPMVHPNSMQVSNEASKNIANSSLTLSQIGGIIIVLGSIAISLFSAWSGLNKEIDSQKNLLEQFKQQIARDVMLLEKNIQELKSVNLSIQTEDKVFEETMEKRLQDLDSTVSQIYQKVNR